MKKGSHTCPGSIHPTKITVSELVCVSIDLQERILIGASVTVTEHLLACVYESASTECTYSTDGSLKSSGSWCPKKVSKAHKSKSSSGYKPSSSPDSYNGGSYNGGSYNGGYSGSKGGYPAAAAAIGNDRLADNSSNNDGGITLSKAVLIALLAMNSVLVLAVLVIGGFLIFGRRSTTYSRIHPLNTGSGGYKTVGSVSVPLTHSDEPQYYDAPTQKY
ncbi:hypothetical protein B0H14DRAFT_2751243 [Mycena olivaceomarginata]|nr:hypothetical protein B0H14DRAFT_2751243 [Mycena olivaceomarginata]